MEVSSHRSAYGGAAHPGAQTERRGGHAGEGPAWRHDLAGLLGSVTSEAVVRFGMWAANGRDVRDASPFLQPGHREARGRDPSVGTLRIVTGNPSPRRDFFSGVACSLSGPGRRKGMIAGCRGKANLLRWCHRTRSCTSGGRPIAVVVSDRGGG